MPVVDVFESIKRFSYRWNMSVMPQRRWRWWRRRRLCLCEIWLKKKPPAPKFPLTCFTMPHNLSAKYFSQTHFIRSVHCILNFYEPVHYPASQIISSSPLPSAFRSGQDSQAKLLQSTKKSVTISDQDEEKSRLFPQDFFCDFLPFLHVYGLPTVPLNTY